MPTKEFLKDCIRSEVYLMNGASSSPPLLTKLYLRYVKPETNAVYLIRKFLYHIGNGSGKAGKIHRLYARYYGVKLLRRYGIFLADECSIGRGLSIRHPHGIFVTNAEIGENFTVYQNCTIGRKDKDTFTERGYVHIGNNVTMYSGSTIVGNAPITDNVTLGAGTVMVKGASKPGFYVGNPAKYIKGIED